MNKNNHKHSQHKYTTTTRLLSFCNTQKHTENYTNLKRQREGEFFYTDYRYIAERKRRWDLLLLGKMGWRQRARVCTRPKSLACISFLQQVLFV